MQNKVESVNFTHNIMLLDEDFDAIMVDASDLEYAVLAEETWELFERKAA